MRPSAKCSATWRHLWQPCRCGESRPAGSIGPGTRVPVRGPGGRFFVPVPPLPITPARRGECRDDEEGVDEDPDEYVASEARERAQADRPGARIGVDPGRR